MSKLVMVTLILLAFSGLATAAEDRCVVTDPTGTPLNVRTGPGQNGMIIGTVENGRPVFVQDHMAGPGGRMWVYIADYRTRRSIGWVYREYISCV